MVMIMIVVPVTVMVTVMVPFTVMYNEFFQGIRVRLQVWHWTSTRLCITSRVAKIVSITLLEAIFSRPSSSSTAMWNRISRAGSAK